MAASIPALASSNTPSFASSWPTVRASRSAYVNCTLRSLRPAIAFVTTSVISGPSVFTGAAGARASSAARASAASRYPGCQTRSPSACSSTPPSSLPDRWLLSTCGYRARPHPGLQGGIGSCSLPELLTARGKRLNRHALHLPHAILTRIHCLVTHRLNIGPERVLVYLSQSDAVGQYVFGKPGFTDGIAGQRLPFIAVLCRIDNHAVRVYLWVLSARCIVVKAGNNQIPGQDRFRNAISLYPCGGKGLHRLRATVTARL